VAPGDPPGTRAGGDRGSRRPIGPEAAEPISTDDISDDLADG
jgi:hypothetical protein